LDIEIVEMKDIESTLKKKELIAANIVTQEYLSLTPFHTGRTL